MNASPTDTEPRTPPEDDRVVAIRELVERAQHHQNDVDELLALHTDDAGIINIAGRFVPDKQAFREAMQQALQSPLADIITTTEIDDIRFVRPGVAIVTCVKHVTDRRDESQRDESRHDDSAQSLPASGRLTYVVSDDGERWRIDFAQTTPVRAS